MCSPTHCFRCYEKYNEEHIPKILPNCGHTLCASCIDHFRDSYYAYCPYDNEPIDRERSSKEYITNLTLLQFIDQKAELDKYGVCTTHNESMSMFCFTDNEKICKFCIEGRDDAKHQGHNVKTFSQLKEEAQAKCSELQLIIDGISEDKRAINSLIWNQLKEVHENKKRKFDQIRNLLDRKEEEMSAEIELLYAQKRAKTEEAFQKDEELKEKVRIDLTMLSKPKMNDKFFDVLNKEIDEKCIVNDKEEEGEKLNTLHRKIVNEFKSKEKFLNKESLLSIFNKHRPNVGLYEMKIEENKEGLEQDNINPLDPIETCLEVKRKGDILLIQYRKVSEPKSTIMKERVFILANADGVRAVHIDLRRRKIWDDIGQDLCLLLASLNNSNIKEFSFNWEHPETSYSYLEIYFEKFLAAQNIEIFTFNKREDRTVTFSNFFQKSRNTFSNDQLKNMVNLKTLSLSMGGQSADYYTLRRFADDVLPNLTKLTTLEIEIDEAQAEERAIEKLLMKMSEILKHVNNFHLNLTRTNASAKCLEALWKHTLPGLGVLENFKLHMDHNKLGDVEVKRFFVGSKALFTKIRVFEISMSFTGGKVSNKAVKALAKHVLPVMTCLENLSLNFTDKVKAKRYTDEDEDGETSITWINDRSVKKIFDKVCPDHIKTFRFHIGGHELTNDAVVSFAHDLLPKLSKLENLDLLFDSQNHFSRFRRTLDKSKSYSQEY